MSISGKRVLVVEDEYFLAEDLREAIEVAGGVVVGPFAAISEAVSALEGDLDVAVLNVHVRDGSTYPLATTLRRRGIPIVFATGQDMHTEPAEWHSPRWISKPYSMTKIIGMLESVIDQGP